MFVRYIIKIFGLEETISGDLGGWLIWVDVDTFGCESSEHHVWKDLYILFLEVQIFGWLLFTHFHIQPPCKLSLRTVIRSGFLFSKLIYLTLDLAEQIWRSGALEKFLIHIDNAFNVELAGFAKIFTEAFAYTL